MKRLFVLLALVLTLALPAQAFAGFFSWGYNYVGSGVNELVASGSNYWTDQYVDKNSGGAIYHGFGPSGSCYGTLNGGTTWYGYPSDLGCGGYITSFVQWHSGSTSYLYFDSYA